jgi:Subtilase family
MTSRRARPALFAAALLLCAPATATAAVPALPMSLPGDASAAGVEADRATWIVGARPGATSQRLAHAHRARSLGAPGAYVVPRTRARAFAGALAARHRLVYAQPDVLRASRQTAHAFGNDPLDDLGGYRWRDHVVSPNTKPPARRKLIVLVDATLDKTHPEFGAGNVTTTGGHPVTNSHGTSTASVAAAPQNGIGFTGLWPGARALNIALDDQISCADSTRGILSAIKRGASVINMSYGSPQFCAPEYLALEIAVAHGIVGVAAAGNELAEGNPIEFPGALPHVVTVGAVGPDDRATQFSNANPAVDLSAPGECIPVAVPLSLGKEDTGCPAAPDGYEYESGTSFAAPMVSAAIAWIRAARPSLKADQAADVVRFSARDVGTRGYDGETGYGVLSVDRALIRPKSTHDPDEPNDGPALIDGTLIGRAAPFFFKGRGAGHRTATVDLTEDPQDWYRIEIPRHGSAHVTLRPRSGNPDVLVRALRTKGKRRSYPLEKRSAHAGARREQLKLANRSRRREILFVGVQPGTGRRLDARYSLTVSR